MKKANIDWFVKETDGIYVSHTDYYAGSCVHGEDFILDIELWNNRWNNSEDVEDIENAKLIVSFANAEDSIFLSLCSVKINDGDYIKPDISDFNRGIIYLGNISGVRNTGTENEIANYKKIAIKFNNIPNNFRQGLRSLFLDIQYDD